MKTLIKVWHGECLRKKKLKECWANDIIERAKKEGSVLFKYYCNHCQHWHVTKRLKNKSNISTD